MHLDNGNVCGTIWDVIEVLEYIDPAGRKPYKRWFDDLNAQAAAKVATAVIRMTEGNMGDSEPVGRGVHECKIHFGPGYRIYYGKEGERIVILVGGGTKKRQQKDIKNAIERWEDYKKRRKQEEK